MLLRNQSRNLLLSVVIILITFLFIPSSKVVSRDLTDTAQELKSFNWDQQTRMEGLDTYARREMNKHFQENLGKKMKGWTKEIRDSWVQKHGRGRGRLPLEMNANYQSYLKEKLTDRLNKNLDKEVKNFVENKLFQGAKIGDDMKGQVDRLMGEVKDGLRGRLSEAMNTGLKRWNQSLNPNELAGLTGINNLSAGFVDHLKGPLSDAMGKATKGGFKDFIDGEMMGLLGGDFKNQLEGMMFNAGEKIEGMVDQVGDLANLENLQGMALDEVNKIKDQLAQSLTSPLGNIENLSVNDLLALGGWSQELLSTLSGTRIKLPSLRLPNPAMAGILVASAARHFSAAFKGFFIDWNELKAAIATLQTLKFQLSANRMQFAVITGELGGRALMGAFGTKISDESKSKLASIIKKAEELKPDMDQSILKTEYAGIMDDLGGLKGEWDGQLKDMLAGMQGGGMNGLGMNGLMEGEHDWMGGLGGGDWGLCGDADSCDEISGGLYSSMNYGGNWDTYGSMESPFANVDCPNDPVVVYSGEFLNEVQDLQIKGRGLNYEFKRYYRNQWERMGDLGYNWVHNFEEKLIIGNRKELEKTEKEKKLNQSQTTDEKAHKNYTTRQHAKDILYHQANGMQYWYGYDEKTKAYRSPTWSADALELSEHGYVLTQANQTKRFFNEHGFLTKIQDRHGNKIQLEYGLVGDKIKLLRVRDTLDRVIEYRYDEKTHLLSSVIDPFNRVIQFSQDEQKDLVKVRSPISESYPEGKITRYSYSGGNLEPRLNHNLTMIMDPKGQVYLKNVYGKNGTEKDRLIYQRFGDKNTPEMKNQYEIVKENVNKTGINLAKNRTVVWDREGIAHHYEHNSNGLLINYWIQNSQSKQKELQASYEYNDKHQVIKKVSANGQVETYQYQTKAGKSLLAKQEIKGSEGNGIQMMFSYNDHGDQLLKKEVIGLEFNKPTSDKRVTTYSYNDRGLVSEIAQAGLKTHYQYNQYGQLKIKEDDQLSLTYEYQGEFPVKITQKDKKNSEVRATQLSYDDYRNLKSMTQPHGAKTNYVYDENNLLVQIQDSLGYKTKYQYDANNNLIEISYENKGGKNANAIGYEVKEKFVYNHLDNITEKKIQISRDQWAVEKYEYDQNEKLIAETGIDGIKYEYDYNFKGQLLAKKKNGKVVESYTYDDSGNMIQVKDALNRVKKYEHDDFNRITAFMDPLNNRVDVDYNGLGQVSGYTVMEAEHQRNDRTRIIREIKINYDSLGRKIAEKTKDVRLSSADQAWWMVQYDYEGRNLKQIKQNQRIIEERSYNGFGEVVEVIKNDLQEKYDYNKQGQVTSLSFLRKQESSEGSEKMDPRLRKDDSGETLKQQFEYDAVGRLIAEINAQGQKTQYQYDSRANLIKEIDPLNQVREYQYDGLGRLIQETQGKRTRKLHWNETNQLVKMTDGEGNIFRINYNKAGEVQSEIDFQGRETAYAYNELGLVTKKKTSSHEEEYIYDKLNRLTQRHSQGYKQEFAYNALGNLIYSKDSNSPQSSNDDIIIQYDYDGLGRVAVEKLIAQGKTYETKLEYDQASNISRVVYPSGQDVYRTYDEHQRLTKIKSDGEILGEYSYTDFGLPKEERLGNGVTKTNEYNAFNQLTQEIFKNQNQTENLSQTNYHYDSLGRLILKENKTKRSWQNYEYNDLGQLASVSSFNDSEKNSSFKGITEIAQMSEQVQKLAQKKTQYQLSSEGQWQKVFKKIQLSKKEIETQEITIAQGKGYQYDKYNEKEIKYDNRGNLIAYGEKLFEYDAWNRLIRVKTLGSKVSAEYKYDAQNRRISKKVTDSDQSQEIVYAYSGWSLLEEYKDGQVVKQYFGGRNLDDVLGYKQDEAIYYYHQDRLGSVTAISNQDGKVLQEYEYDEYGNREVIFTGDSRAATVDENAISYTGQYHDEESDLYYYKNRYYIPEIGRFITQDPLGFIDGPNQYAYVNNDPVNFVDPMGTQSAGDCKKKSNYWNTYYTGQTGFKWDVFSATNFQSDNYYLNELYGGINGTVGIFAYAGNVINNAGGLILFDAPAGLEDLIVSNGGPSFNEIFIASRGTPIPFDDVGAGIFTYLSRYSRTAGNFIKASSNTLKLGNSRVNKFWKKVVSFKGNKVYQRSDLINPKFVDSKTGLTNLQLMKKGRAPIGPDGKPINLHHTIQTQGGGIAEMTQTFHQTNSKVIHINPNTIPSGINRSQFNSWKKDYWINRAKDFE